MYFATSPEQKHAITDYQHTRSHITLRNDPLAALPPLFLFFGLWNISGFIRTFERTGVFLGT